MVKPAGWLCGAGTGYPELSGLRIQHPDGVADPLGEPETAAGVAHEKEGPDVAARQRVLITAPFDGSSVPMTLRRTSEYRTGPAGSWRCRPETRCRAAELAQLALQKATQSSNPRQRHPYAAVPAGHDDHGRSLYWRLNS